VQALDQGNGVNDMIRAEVLVELGGRGFGERSRHVIQFESVETATAQYERVAALFKSREDRKNDLPRELEIIGVNKITCQLDDVSLVGLVDFKKSNDELLGFRDEFPQLRAK
jgi:hypothetical protein